MCDLAQVSAKLKRSVSKLYSHDAQLIAGKAHEQAVTACLKRYLHDEFPESDVDCEYNRDDRDPDDIKRDRDRAAMRPDIVVHQRRTQTNLLAIEVKPYWSPVDRDEDFARLEHLTGNRFNYSLGAHVELGRDGPTFTWFSEGRPVGDPHV